MTGLCSDRNPANRGMSCSLPAGHVSPHAMGDDGGTWPLVEQPLTTEIAECGHRDCAGNECPKCGTPPCCWHRDDCDHYRGTPPDLGWDVHDFDPGYSRMSDQCQANRGACLLPRDHATHTPREATDV